mmetsp:Transcript_49738/g.118575  ORF Transcript_49738/g.118575 Transcript_49738/m.118575 type:complete len:660 (+) Transcript_49738:58-2037(+)
MVLKNVRSDEGRALLEVLDGIRQGARPGHQGGSAISVRILAAADHDGVCAAKILSTVLSNMSVMYTIVPVMGNTEVVKHIEGLREDTEVRSLVLLNCGGGLQIKSTLEEHLVPKQIHCYLIDAHRPIHLENLLPSNDRVTVLDDDPIAEVNGSTAPIDDSSSESEGEAEADTLEEEKENVYGSGENSLDSGMDDGRKRRRDRREDRLESKRRKREEYYLFSYYATPAAMVLFKMARQAAPPTQDLLWLAAVSLAGYHELGLINEVEHSKLASGELAEALERTGDHQTASTQSSGSMSQPDATHLDGRHPDADGGLTQRGRPKTRHPPRRRRLRYEEDLRLNLYKHWTLEQSLMHSPYFYGTMRLHTEQGIRSLKAFFATCGINPSDYRQQYISMELGVRKNLVKKFRERGRQYGLGEKMFLPQFIKDMGSLGETNTARNLSELSSADISSVVIALLSAIPPNLSGAHFEALPKVSSGARDADAVHEMERQALTANFWHAMDAVLGQDPGVLADSLSEAEELIKTVQSSAKYLMEAKMIKTERHFRWCKVEQPAAQFRHHMALRHLAGWLLQVAFQHKSGEGGGKPLLLIIHDHVRQSYLCLGARPQSHAERNEFGSLFRRVLKDDSTLRYAYDFFDKSVIEIQEVDWDRFWNALKQASS